MRVIVPLLVAATLSPSASVAQQESMVDIPAIQAALAANPQGADAERLANQIREAFGGREALMSAPNPLIEETTVLWAIELPDQEGRPPRVLNPAGSVRYGMSEVGSTGVYALAQTFSSGEAFGWMYDVGGDGPGGGGTIEVYNTHPDSRERPDVPKGELTQMPPWESDVFPGTTRDWWVYVPAQYTPEEPAAVMVFQDGNAAKNWVPTVFDNLIHKGDIPVMVGVFIEPGGVERPRDNRSYEYDRLSDQYVRLLLEEMLPEVQNSVNLRTDAAGRAIAGHSSGGIAAFTAAWERPDEFSKVISADGSFVNLQPGESGYEGGHNYQQLVRRTPPKPIRVYMLDGENDQNHPAGNWWLANVTLANSLEWAGYDHHFERGKGYHNTRQWQATMPDVLRWLWRD